MKLQNRWGVTLAFLDFFLKRKLLLFKPLVPGASYHSEPDLILSNSGPRSARQTLFCLI